jgi:hypothetical protein
MVMDLGAGKENKKYIRAAAADTHSNKTYINV